MTSVFSVELLLAALGFGSLAVTVAVLISVPLADDWTETTMVTAPLAPLGSAPGPQVIVPLASEQIGAPGLDETNVTPAGRVSTNITPVVSDGPLLVVVTV
jgi:hypothetical protein